MTEKIRTFETGATRDQDIDKFDYEGFLSPQVLEEFARYMHQHRQQSDGSMRASDNWQKGIPFEAYMKSLWRHLMDLWKAHRGLPAPSKKESLCAMLFNVQGYLLEELKKGEVLTEAAAYYKDMAERASGEVPEPALHNVTPPFGYFTMSGKWSYNPVVRKSEAEQRAYMVRAGRVCAICDRAPMSCLCAKTATAKSTASPAPRPDSPEDQIVWPKMPDLMQAQNEAMQPIVDALQKFIDEQEALK